MEITIVVDNEAAVPGLTAEFGLAMHLRTDDWTFLFDTGTSGLALLENARTLGIDLREIAGVALSHSHFDHTGGLALLAQFHPSLHVYCNSELFGRGTQDELGRLGATVHNLEGPTEVLPGLQLSGFVPDEGTSAPPRSFSDETFMIAEGDTGPVLLSGCCHRGIEATMAYAGVLRSSAGKPPVRTVVGGLHLSGAGGARLRNVTEVFSKHGVTRLYPNHCTGREAVNVLALGPFEDVKYVGAGEKLIL
jgi:7,8-dihydropterin-6-yl-methyl-4-(beta-D-ribofuranosyl)aminobenzene 5'-phosphate synthase